MAQGLQVYNSSGVEIYHSDDSHITLLGYVDTGAVDGSHVITHPLKAEGELFLFTSVKGILGAAAIATLSGYTINWEYSIFIGTNIGKANTRIYYGLK